MRFAVLHHTGIDEPHFDLLFETEAGSSLVTYRLTVWPVDSQISATKLRDHRRLYLTYQGDVPGERGRVDRVDEGEVFVEKTTNAGWTLVRTDGRRLIHLRPDESAADPAQWLAEL